MPDNRPKSLIYKLMSDIGRLWFTVFDEKMEDRMPWDDTARVEHRRDCTRYPGDLTDREWTLIAPLLPPARRGGRARTSDLRAVTDAIFHIGISGCQWRMLPKDSPPVSTVRGYVYAWRNAGLWQTINHLLVAGTHELEGREASPHYHTGGGCDRQPEHENDREWRGLRL